MGAGAESWTGTSHGIGGRAEVKMEVGPVTGTGAGSGGRARTWSNTGVGSGRELVAGMVQSWAGAEPRTANGTGVRIGDRRNSVIGIMTKTEARTGFGGASGFKSELMRTGGSVLKKRRRSVSSQFYY